MKLLGKEGDGLGASRATWQALALAEAFAQLLRKGGASWQRGGHNRRALARVDVAVRRPRETRKCGAFCDTIYIVRFARALSRAAFLLAALPIPLAQKHAHTPERRLNAVTSDWRSFTDTIYIVCAAAAFAALLSTVPSTAHADTCMAELTLCTERGDIEVGGVRLTDVCLKTERAEHCTRDAPADSCAQFASLSVDAADPLENGQCTMVAETCTRSVNGVCDSWDREYRCWNGPAEAAGADLISRQYRNFAETITSDCAALEGDGSCSYVDTVNLEGAGSRIINEYPINRLWWVREERFQCAGQGPVDNCGPIEADPVCAG